MRRHDAKVLEPFDAYDAGKLKETLTGLNALWGKTGVALDGTLRLFDCGPNSDREVTFRFYFDGVAEKYQIEVLQ